MKRKILICTFILTAITLTGCAQKSTESSPISEEQAKEVALTHAGLTSDQITFVKVGIDRDNGKEKYEIEFYTNDRNEYDYEIDLYTGEILDYDYDAENYTHSTISNNDNSVSVNDAAATITADEAKQIALDEVPGSTLENIIEFKTEYDNNTLVYDGKIHYEQKEYNFEIDAYTGAILEWDIENR